MLGGVFGVRRDSWERYDFGGLVWFLGIVGILELAGFLGIVGLLRLAGFLGLCKRLRYYVLILVLS